MEKAFLFYGSFFDSLMCLPKKSERWDIVEAICNYTETGLVNKMCPRLLSCFFLIKPILDKELLRRKSGNPNFEKGKENPYSDRIKNAQKDNSKIIKKPTKKITQGDASMTKKKEKEKEEEYTKKKYTKKEKLKSDCDKDFDSKKSKYVSIDKTKNFSNNCNFDEKNNKIDQNIAPKIKNIVSTGKCIGKSNERSRSGFFESLRLENHLNEAENSLAFANEKDRERPYLFVDDFQENNCKKTSHKNSKIDHKTNDESLTKNSNNICEENSYSIDKNTKVMQRLKVEKEEDFEDESTKVEQRLNNENVIEKVKNNEAIFQNSIKQRTKNKCNTPPTIEQILEYINEKNLDVDAETFFDFYESKDWYIGRNKMSDFRACLRNWNRGFGHPKEIMKPNNSMKKYSNYDSNSKGYSERKYSKEFLDSLYDSIDDIKI